MEKMKKKKDEKDRIIALLDDIVRLEQEINVLQGLKKELSEFKITF